jgi:hypothetical protein
MTQVQVRKWHTDGESRAFGWQLIQVEQALLLKDETFRCPECHGRVKLMNASQNPPMAAHREHFQRNHGCSLGDCFDGEHRMHTAALP